MNLFRSIRASENLHVVFWLFKDLSWLMGWKPLGMAMILPTLGLAIWIAWRSRAEIGELLHCLAVVFWIAANGIWMTGEFFYEDHTRKFALPFFIAGTLCVAWYYLVVLPRRSRDTGPEVTQRSH